MRGSKMRMGSIQARSALAAAIAIALAAIAALALLSSAGGAGQRPPADGPQTAAVTRFAPADWCDDTLLERRVFVIAASPASAFTRRWNSLAEMQAADVNWYLRIGEGYDCNGNYTINHRTYWSNVLPSPIALVEAPPAARSRPSGTWSGAGSAPEAAKPNTNGARPSSTPAAPGSARPPTTGTAVPASPTAPA